MMNQAGAKRDAFCDPGMGRKMKRWTALIDDMVAGHWINPETGKPGRVPYKSVVIAETLDGREAELVTSVGIKGRVGVVCDQRTREVMGSRVAKALLAAHNSGISGVETIVLDDPHADEAHVDALRERTAHVDALVAVGSGTINDLCKYVTATDGRDYCVFGTAPSMNGYTSTTASITLTNGLKVSKPAHAPLGVFIDLSVNAAVPTYLVASGFGDCLARSVAQFDWWLSHRMLDTLYTELPFRLEREDEQELMARAPDLAKGGIEAIGLEHHRLDLAVDEIAHGIADFQLLGAETKIVHGAPLSIGDRQSHGGGDRISHFPGAGVAAQVFRQMLAFGNGLVDRGLHALGGCGRLWGR